MDFFTSSEYMEGRVASRGRPPLLWYFLFWAALVLAACTGGVAPSSDPAAQGSTYYTIGGTVTGLTGSGLTLQNNKGDNLSVTAAGTFSFETPVIRGNSYSVSVLTQPSTPTQTCAVSNGSGTVTGDNVTNVTVTCADKTSTTDHIGGTVTGLAGSGLVLQNNGTDSLPVSSNGSFTFATALPVGMPYAVTVLTPPMDPFQNCSILSGTGTTTSADVNNIAVSCKTNSNPTYTVGGSISGIATSGPITLQNNGTDDLSLTADGMFTFATPIPSGSAYSVTALGSTTSKTRTCAFTNATGIVPAANVTNVIIKCAESTPIVNITVSVSDLTGSGLVLQNNGADDLAISGNGAFTFATGIASGSAYAVTILTQPSAQTCTIPNGAGTASSGAVPISVVCAPNYFSLSATVSGLAPGAQLSLNDTGAAPLLILANGTSTFAIRIPFDGSYAVTVSTQPVGETCTVSNGTGAGVTANVTVAVNCAVNTFTVSVTVSGLNTGSQVTLDNNGADPLTLTSNTDIPQGFKTPVAYGGSYAVTVGTQPVGETCTVSNGTGAGVTANVTVTVKCAEKHFTVSATVSGLTTGSQVTLDNNGADPLTFTSNTDIPQGFKTPVAYGGSYAVTVGTQPVGETCTVSKGTGAGVTANVTVTVNCAEKHFTVSATVSGLTTGSQVTLDNNGADPLTFTSNTDIPQGFKTPVAYGGSYAVTVGTQPVGETCTVSKGTGAGVTANVIVAVNCAENTFTVSATVSGLTTGSQVTLDNNGADPLTLTSNTDIPQVFKTPVAYGGSYAVTVGTQPVGETCTVSKGTGAGVTANVTVAVNCAVNTFTVSVTVSGLNTGSQVTLDNNGADPLTLTSNTDIPQGFKTPVAYGGSYAVTVGTQPVGETCTVSQGTGAGVTANVTVAVNCAVNTFTVSVTVSGLTRGNQVTLDNNGADPLTFTRNTDTPQGFKTPVAYGGSYAVTVGTQPVSETCTVSNGTGAGVTANVTVTVSCDPNIIL